MIWEELVLKNLKPEGYQSLLTDLWLDGEAHLDQSLVKSSMVFNFHQGLSGLARSVCSFLVTL